MTSPDPDDGDVPECCASGAGGSLAAEQDGYWVSAGSCHLVVDGDVVPDQFDGVYDVFGHGTQPEIRVEYDSPDGQLVCSDVSYSWVSGCVGHVCAFR